MPRDADDFFTREFFGRPLPAEPSPGPWSMKKHRQRDRFGGEYTTVWVVLDANGKYVAECDKAVDAYFIVQNGPSAAATTKGGT